MKTLTLDYPQEAPVCTDTLMDYIHTWHKDSCVEEQNRIKIVIEDDMVESEVSILREHFPWLDVTVIK